MLIYIAHCSSAKYCRYLEIDNILPSLDDAIYIPQHPSGGDMELAIFDSSRFAGDVGGLCHISSTGMGGNDNTCSVYGADFNDFAYICDTEGGSSGAPVMSADTHKVVGLHHCGGGCGDNYAIPFKYIYNDVMAIVNDDIATAVEPTPSPTSDSNAAYSSSSAKVAGTRWGDLIAYVSLSMWSWSCL
jgi:hypothetical protein